MNKTQLYTLSGALLASTALSSVAGAATVGRYAGVTTSLTTSPVEVANLLFSTDADDANAVVLGTGNNAAHFGAEFDNLYLGADASGGTEFSIEFIPTGARFVQASLQLASVKFQAFGTDSTTIVHSVSAAAACSNVTNLATRFTIQNCTAGDQGGTAGWYGFAGAFLTGVTFNNASGLASVDAVVSLSVAVLDPNSSTAFEPASSGTIITSVAPIEVDIDPGADVEADPTTTPSAFASLSNSNETGDLSITLATIQIDQTGAVAADLTSVLSQESAVGTVAITVESGILSGGATALLTIEGVFTTTIETVANFSGGSYDFPEFLLTSAASGTSFRIKAVFDGETAIDTAVAGEVTVSLGADSATSQAFGEVTGETAAVNQGGFNSQVNGFNSTVNGATGYGSLLRIHNNGSVAGSPTITVYNGTTGDLLGSYTTEDPIETNSTLQLLASDIEDGADIATDDRTGSYTIVVTGPLLGYLQHLLYDGVNGLVADVTSFRNGGGDAAP